MKKSIFNLLKFTTIISGIAMGQACTERIDIDVDKSSTRCVIYGEITTDTTSHLVKITRSADYFSNKPAEPISGAVLSISDGTNVFPLTESTTKPGNYYTNSNVYGVPGKTYTLNVSNVDLLGDGVMQSYTAIAELKNVSKLDSVGAEFDKTFDMWAVKLWALDPEEDNYYMFKLSINDKLYTDSLINLTVTDDQLFNGNYTNGIQIFFLEEKDTLDLGDKITVEGCGITKDYYNFISEAQTLIRGQDPLFSGPPANVRSNINNNALGYFAAYSIARSSDVVKTRRKQ